MDDYNTLFDSDLAEHEYIKSQPVKSPEAAPSAPTISSAPAASANTVDSLKRTNGGADVTRWPTARGASFLRGDPHDRP